MKAGRSESLYTLGGTPPRGLKSKGIGFKCMSIDQFYNVSLIKNKTANFNSLSASEV